MSIDGALDCTSASGRNAHPEIRSQGVSKIKRENSGISIPECQSCYRRQRDGVPAVRSPEPLGRRDLHSVSAIRPWLRRFSIWLLVTAKASLHFRMRFRPMEYPSSGAQRESSDRSAGITTILSQLSIQKSVRSSPGQPNKHRGAAIWAKITINFVGREAKERVRRWHIAPLRSI